MAFTFVISVMPGVTTMGRPNIEMMRSMSATRPPLQGPPSWAVNPALLALAEGGEMLTNALVLDASRVTRAPIPNSVPGTGNPGQNRPSNYPMGRPAPISPFLLSGNSELAETLALQSLMSGRRGARPGIATTLALSQGSDAVRNAMMMNAIYPNNDLGSSMLLMRGSDAAKDAYIINSLNRGRGGQNSYMNTLGATGALGDTYRDMLATKAVLQETNPIKQSMLSNIMDIPDSTRQLIMYRALQGGRRPMRY